MEDLPRSVKMPLFNGDRKMFTIFWIRFQGYAVVKGFNDAIMENLDPNLLATDATVIDLATPEGLRQASAKKKNSVAIASMTMAFSTQGLLAMIINSMSIAWPSGLAHTVREQLFHEYRPTDIVALVEVRTALNAVRMKKKADPKDMLEEIAGIRYRYGTVTRPVTEEECIAVAIDAAPEIYAGPMVSEQRSKGTALTLKDLEDCMTQLYRQMPSKRSHGKHEVTEDESEMVLGAFAGLCHGCHQRGHMIKDCPNKKKHGPGNKKKCSHCGKNGHEEATCWEKAGNESKRPAWYQTRERAAAAIDEGSRVEFLLTVSEGPALMHHKDIWIADTGASCHITNNQEGMRDIRDATASDGVTMGNAQVEPTSYIGNIAGDFCDRLGNKIVSCTLGDVSFVKTCAYQLLR
jgi:hypothetical protein